MSTNRAPQRHEVVVRVTHCGVGRGDVDFTDGTYELPALTQPAIAGHEAVGLVTEIGKDVTQIAVGDRVGVGFQVDSCAHCRYCLAGREQLCPEQQCLIVDRPGALSGSVVADERFVFALPNVLSSEVAAPLMCAGAVAYSAVRHILSASKSSHVETAVVGVGGVGHIAVQLLTHAGYPVTAIDLRKLRVPTSAGDITTISPSETTRGRFDFVIHATADPTSFDDALGLTSSDGTVISIGSPTKRLHTSVDTWNYQVGRTIRGVYLASPSDIYELLRIAPEILRPVVEMFSIDDLPKVLDVVRNDQASLRAVVEF